MTEGGQKAARSSRRLFDEAGKRFGHAYSRALAVVAVAMEDFQKNWVARRAEPGALSTVRSCPGI